MMPPNEELLAWMKLLDKGVLDDQSSTREVVRMALDTGVATATKRRGRVALQREARSQVEARLDTLFPRWRVLFEALHERRLPCTLKGIQELHRALDDAPIPAAFRRLNQHTAVAWIRGDAKAILGLEDEPALLGRTVTHDNGLRIRPHAGLLLERSGAILPLDPYIALLGETFLPQRAFLDGLRLAGAPPTRLLLIENLGVYVDLEARPGECLIHVPGWNTVMVRHICGVWPGVPSILFGDLDPNGVMIARSLREAWPELRWFTPELPETLMRRARPCPWPDLPEDMPPIIERLARLGLWVEQELMLREPEILEALRG